MPTQKEIIKQQTKSKLFDALVLLMESKSFDHITVTQVCQEAGVSRMAFYRNYNTLIDVIDQFFSESFKCIVESNLENNTSIHYANTVLVDFVLKNSHFFQLMAQSNEARSLYDYFKQLIGDYIHLYDYDKDFAEQRKEAVISYCAGGVYHTISDWALDNYKMSQEDIIIILDRLHFTNTQPQ